MAIAIGDAADAQTVGRQYWRPISEGIENGSLPSPDVWSIGCIDQHDGIRFCKYSFPSLQHSTCERLTISIEFQAGCVHFNASANCEIKVLILLYAADKKAYLGFVPINQIAFVDNLRKVIQQKQGLRQAGATGNPGNMQQQVNPGNMPPQQPGQGNMQQQGPSNSVSRKQWRHISKCIYHLKSMRHVEFFSLLLLLFQQMKMNAMDGGSSGQMQNFDNFNQMPGQMQGQMQMSGQMQDNMQQQMSTQQEFNNKMAMMQQQQQMRMNSGMNPQGNQMMNAQRMIRPMMANNNPGLRHLLQQQVTKRTNWSHVICN